MKSILGNKSVQSILLGFNLFLLPHSFAYCQQIDTIEQSIHLEENQEVVDKLLDHVSYLLNNSYNAALDIIQLAQQLSLLVNNNQIIVACNKRELLDVFRTIQGLLTTILNEQVLISSIEEPQLKLIYSNNLIEISNIFLKAINTLLDTKFKKIPEIDLSMLIKRGPKMDVSIDECQKNLHFLNQKINEIKSKANNAGLTWYNIGTRQFEKYIIDPSIKYHLPKMLKYGSMAAGIIGLLYWIHSPNNMISELRRETRSQELTQEALEKAYIKLCKENRTFKLTAHLQKHFGVPIPKGLMGSIDNEAVKDIIYDFLKDKSQEFSQIIPLRELCVTLEGWASGLGLGHLPHISFFGALYFAECKQLWVQELKHWFIQKRDTTWNFLRGGAYNQKTVSGVWDMQPSIRFKDVVGMDEIKEQFSFVIKFIENPEQYIRVNAAPPRGYFLTGPTRTGKTYIVDAFCGEIQYMLEKNGRKNEMKFWRVNSQIIGEFGLQQVLNFAKENAPIVLFIDEIDLHGLQRVTNNRMLEQFLTALGNTLDNDPRKQVILITATNKPETLDKALRQPDRLGKEIRFEYPSLSYRQNYLKVQLEKMGIDINNFDLHIIAQKTTGKSFADLNSMLNNAIMRSWIHGKQLSQELFEQSIDSELRHIIFEDRKELTESELRILATHLTGKAIVALLLNTRLILDKVTIKAVMPDLQEELPFEEIMKKNEKEQQQKIRHGEVFRYLSNDTVNIGSYEQKINEIKFLIAGTICEEIILGSTSYEYRHEDLNKAYLYAQDIAFEGIDPKILGKKEFNDLSQKAYKLLSECKDDVRTFMKEHQKQIESIITILLAKKTVTAQEISSLIK